MAWRLDNHGVREASFTLLSFANIYLDYVWCDSQIATTGMMCGRRNKSNVLQLPTVPVVLWAAEKVGARKYR